MSATPRPTARRLRSEQAGFTLVEALVAAILVALAALAVFTAFDTARRASYRAEQSQVATAIAEQELEGLRALSYNEVSLTGTPSSDSDPDSPASRVLGLNYALNDDGGDAQPMVINGGSLYGGGTVSGGTIDPTPEPFSNGDVSGTIYRYVTWKDDPNCLPLTCPGAQDLKRVVVAVTLATTPAGGARGYAELQSDVIDPDDSLLSDVNLPDLGDLVIAQQFWLSDERCINSGEPGHSTTLTSHSARDTFGDDCKSTTSGRPDALLTTTPANLDATLDYATDLEPTPSTADAGLQFLLGSSNGCQFKPTGSDGYKTSHIWVTSKFTSTFAMTGGATLEIWTRAINDITTSGSLCVTLFTRTEDPLGLLPPTDVRLINTDTLNSYFTSTSSSWPSGDWRKLRVPMSFAPSAIIPGQRLGIAIGLEKSASPSDQLMFQYDQVELDSRLEVETTTPLAG